MTTASRSLVLMTSVSALLLLSACSGVSEMTRQQVARSETAVNQAQTTLGNSEAGAIELQQAKDYYQQAKKAVDDNDDIRAQRLANQAELNAQLAVAKSQSATARKAADELIASIQTLRQETNRSTTAQP